MSTSTLPSNPAEDAGPGLRSITIIFTVIAVTVMSARLFVRATIIRAVGIDDWTMAFVTLVSIGGLGVVIAEVQHGVGRHIGDVPPDEYAKGLKLNFVTQLVYLYGICFAKLAVGASLLRIASTRLWKNVILGCMVFVFVYTTVGFSTILAQCSDVRANWDSSIEATCWTAFQVQLAAYINFSLNVATDLIFALVIPLCMLWNLNMSFRTKLSLFFILGLGCFVCACAVVRISYLGAYGASGDWLWDTVHLAVWSVIELNVGIIAGSLPSLRPLVRRFLGSIYGSGSRGGAGGGGRSNNNMYYAGGLSSGRSKSRGSRGGGRWARYASGGGTLHSQHHHHHHRLPHGHGLADGGLPLDDASSQKNLHDPASPSAVPGEMSKGSFEMSCYGVESHITSGKARRPSEDFPTGITKTTQMTVSYDDSRHV